VVLEQIGIPDVPTYRIDRAMAANVHHFENRASRRRRGCQKAGPKRVTGKEIRIETNASSVRFDDIGHDRSLRPSLLTRPTLLTDLNRGPVSMPAAASQSPERLNGASNHTAHDGNHAALAFLVRLGAA